MAADGKGHPVKVPTALVGCQVWRIAFDYQVRLILVGGHPDDGDRVNAELVIETAFRLRDAAGEWHELDPGTGSRLAPVLELFTKTISGVEIRGHGGLVLMFEDGAELFVGPDPRFESWQLSGDGVDGILVGPADAAH